MKKIMYIVPLVLIGLAVLWTIGSYFFTRSIKSPEYTVVETKEGYEIRNYESYLVAQVEVSGSYDEATNKGFTILADYIFGNNAKKEAMAMTVPVTEVSAVSEKIAMTAPVLETEAAATGNHIISFVMPVTYNEETLPKPNNPEIMIRRIPPQKIAALTFSWYATDKRVQQKKQELASLLKRDELTAISDLQVARYNAPSSAPWLNRNEIMIELQ